MYKYKRTDFIETDLKSQLMESFDHHMVTMETMRQEFEKYKTRLGVVRQEKEKTRIELLGKTVSAGVHIVQVGMCIQRRFKSVCTSAQSVIRVLFFHLKNMGESFVVVFVFNVPLTTAKVIWRWGHGLKSHPTDW